MAEISYSTSAWRAFVFVSVQAAMLCVGSAAAVGPELPNHTTYPATAFPGFEVVLRVPAQADLLTSPAPLQAWIAIQRGRPVTEAAVSAVNQIANALPQTDRYPPFDPARRAPELPYRPPAEFLWKGGNCADAALAKYHLLRAIGHDPEMMWVGIVAPANDRSYSHAVLLVQLGPVFWVLDQGSAYAGSFRRLTERPDMDFLYTANETGVWRHLKHNPRRSMADAR